MSAPASPRSAPDAAAGSARSRRGRRWCAPLFGLFFNPRPLHLLPMNDGLFVALPRPSHRPLTTPLQPAQNPPDVAVVVPNPKLLFDQMSHPPQGPQRCLVAQGFRSLQQTLLQPLQVLRTQTRLAPGPTGLLQSLRPLLRPAVAPIGSRWCGSPSSDGLLRTRSILAPAKPPLAGGGALKLRSLGVLLWGFPC